MTSLSTRLGGGAFFLLMHADDVLSKITLNHVLLCIFDKLPSLYFSTGVSNIVRSQDKDGRRIVDFDIQERLVLLGFYETSNSTFHVTTKALEENVATQLTAKPLRGMVKINQGFDFSDAKKGNEDGTMLDDHAEYTAPRILARFVLREAVAAHTAITQNIRQHFMEVSQQAMDDI